MILLSFNVHKIMTGANANVCLYGSRSVGRFDRETTFIYVL